MKTLFGVLVLMILALGAAYYFGVFDQEDDGNGQEIVASIEVFRCDSAEDEARNAGDFVRAHYASYGQTIGCTFEGVDGAIFYPEALGRPSLSQCTPHRPGNSDWGPNSDDEDGRCHFREGETSYMSRCEFTCE